MSNATPTTRPECRRCKGEGMGQHSRANGACYLCGRLPGEGHAVKEVVAPADARWRSIEDLRVLLANATREQAAGELAEWLDLSCGYGDPTTLQTIRAQVNAAPADVASRARAAFARIGVVA
jgi:hypothetical protein